LTADAPLRCGELAVWAKTGREQMQNFSITTSYAAAKFLVVSKHITPHQIEPGDIVCAAMPVRSRLC
jgi:hypothetical protein